MTGVAQKQFTESISANLRFGVGSDGSSLFFLFLLIFFSKSINIAAVLFHILGSLAAIAALILTVLWCFFPEVFVTA